MSDKFPLVPEGTPQAVASVANNLIDKLASAVGFVFIPRGSIKEKEQAVSYFVEEIKNNESMSPLEKAATISNARKIIKEYVNQNSVLDIAMSNMKESARPDEIDDDWLTNFMDKASRISNKDVQLLLGKLLAEECNNPESISRSVVNTLTSMDKNSAFAFRKICKYSITILGEEKEVCAVIPEITDFDKYHMDLKFGEIVDLTSLGLIEYEGLSGYGIICEKGEIEINYSEELIKLKTTKSHIRSGKVNLTRIGEELAKIFVRDVDMQYFEKIKEYWKKDDVEIIEIQ